MSKKPTNPKDKMGIAKIPLSVIPGPVLAELGAALFEGARKYGRHNWRVAEALASVYYDAAFRHLVAWYEGEDDDPDSGLSHITKAIASLTVLRDAMIQKKWIDDRPPPTEAGWLAELNKKAAAIIEHYPDCVEPWTALRITSAYDPSEITEELQVIRKEKLGLCGAVSCLKKICGEYYCDAHECALASCYGLRFSSYVYCEKHYNESNTDLTPKYVCCVKNCNAFVLAAGDLCGPCQQPF